MRGHVKAASKPSFPQTKRACLPVGRSGIGIKEDKQPIPGKPE